MFLKKFFSFNEIKFLKEKKDFEEKKIILKKKKKKNEVIEFIEFIEFIKELNKYDFEKIEIDDYKCVYKYIKNVLEIILKRKYIGKEKRIKEKIEKLIFLYELENKRVDKWIYKYIKNVLEVLWKIINIKEEKKIKEKIKKLENFVNNVYEKKNYKIKNIKKKNKKYIENFIRYDDYLYEFYEDYFEDDIDEV